MGRRLGGVAIGVLVVAAVELVLLALVVHWLGLLVTVLLVLATSAVGGWVLRREGLRAWRTLREAAREGRPPGAGVSRGALGLLGGLLLVVPGFLSDLVGLLLLLPPVRALAGGGVQRFVARRLSPAAAGDLFGPRRVRVQRGDPVADGEPIEGEIVDRG